MKKPNIYKRDQACVSRMLPSDPTGSLDDFFCINEIILFSYYERKRDTEFSRSHHLIDVCSNCIQLKKEDFKNCLLEK